MIAKAYTELFYNNLLKDRYLSRGISPSKDQKLAALVQAMNLDLGLDGSSINFTQDEGETGSAKEFNNTLSTAVLELKAIFLGSDRIKDLANRIFDRLDNDISLLGNQAIDISLEACTLQNAIQSGFSYSAYDSFKDMLNIDQHRTSAAIDVSNRSVSLPAVPSIKRYTLSHLEEQDFQVIVTNGSYIGLSLKNNARFINLVDDTESYWMHQLIANDIKQKTIALQINLRDLITINRLEAKLIDADTESGNQIRILGSLDSAKWQEISARTSYGSGGVIIDLIPSNIRYLRIEMTKDKPSYILTEGTVSYGYEFGLDNLKLFQTKFYPVAEITSNSISFNNAYGNIQKINKIQIDPAEIKPDGTDITYYISRNDSTIIERIEAGKPYDLDILVDVKETQGKARRRFDTNHAVINIELHENFIPNTVRFFRNTYQQNVFIDNVQAGWKLENSYYSCVFEIEEELEINLGINFAYIDGRKKNGINLVKPGIHTFRTHEVNWKLATSEASDPLFPYNHKLIIEGLRDSTIYKGADFVTAEELKMVSTFDLIKNIANNDTAFFAIRERYPLIKIARPPVLAETIEGWRLEQYSVRYKYSDTNVSNVESIKVIARLSTNNSNFTPIFKGYTIIAGY